MKGQVWERDHKRLLHWAWFGLTALIQGIYICCNLVEKCALYHLWTVWKLNNRFLLERRRRSEFSRDTSLNSVAYLHHRGSCNDDDTILSRDGTAGYERITNEGEGDGGELVDEPSPHHNSTAASVRKMMLQISPSFPYISIEFEICESGVRSSSTD